MTIETNDYAFLSDDVYNRNAAGGRIPGQNNQDYLVLEFCSDPATGYAGMIYKNATTGEIVVSHRGTQFGNDWQDLVADAQMVVNLLNQQIFGARHLVRRALELAAADGNPVTVTGHSLGGALAQITAYEFGLTGQTFNSYGAAGLYGTPEGGGQIINYIRATDMVAAAGTHFGETKFYAQPIDVDLLFRNPKAPPLTFLNAIYLNPDITHTPKQFYGENSIINEVSEGRYNDAKLLYDLYRAQIWSVAHGIGAAIPAAAILPGPEQAGFSALMRYLYGSYEGAAARAAYLGTGEAETFIGTAGADYIAGLGGIDSLQGAGGDDILKGDSGDDVLRGQGGNDAVFGGDGDDYLDGGGESDRLEGGAGYDTYNFSASDFSQGSADTVVDSDDQGIITFEQVPFGNYTFDPIWIEGLGWKTQDGVFRLQVIGQALVIVHNETGGRILVQNWINGRFGITLPAVDTPTQQNPLLQTNGDDLVGDDGHPSPTNPISGADIVSGLDGNDGIDGGYGNDWIDGGLGDDLIFGGPGSNELIGGGGDDILISAPFVMGWSRWDETVMGPLLEVRTDVGSYGNGWYAYTADGSAYTGDAFQRLSRLGLTAWGYEGSDPQTEGLWFYPNPDLYKNEADNITAGAGADTAYGGDGDDRIDGGTGNDVLIGGRDSDSISGGDDDDLILGDELTSGTNIFVGLSQHVSSGSNASGNDILTGGAGNDRIYGQGGNDIIGGGDGNDILSGDRLDYGLPNAINQPVVSGDDYIDGGAGNDEIYGDGGNDTLLGGSGTDTIVGDSVAIDGSLHGDDILAGGADADTVFGMGGDDVINGDEGDDLLIGDANVFDLALPHHGNDILYGDAGNDELQGGGGDDLLDGGIGNDTLFGEGGRDVLLGGDGIDQLSGGDGDDSVDGGAQNDALFGEAGADRLMGGTGDDELQGGDGNDYLEGGDGIDRLFGQADNDSLHGQAGDDELQGGDGNDTLDGGADNDKLWGDAGDDILIGGGGWNEMAGGAGADSIYGGSGPDIVNGNEGNDLIYGGDGGDNLSGNEDNDTIYAGAGADYVGGDGGNDALYGEAGNDTLVGGEGDDLLNGGLGNDQITGGTGNDTYRFDGEFGTDTVVGLAAADSGNDTIVLGDGISAADTNAYIYGNDLIIQFGREEYSIYTTWRNQVTLQGFAAAGGRHNVVFADGSVSASGDAGANLIVGSAGNDNLDGKEGDDTIEAGAGNDRIIGGAGEDTAYGGAGDDIYFGVETIVEAANEGLDTVYLRGETPSNYTLADNVENLDILSDNINQFKTIDGNGLDNVITLRNGSNWLTWGASIDGGAGADKYVYYGDTPTKYISIYVDNIGDSWEGWMYAPIGGGVYAGTNQFDVWSTLEIDFTFDSSVREFHSQGTQAITITGDERDNILDGSYNPAANTLKGGAGDDTYRVDASDIVVENAGSGTADKILLQSGTITSYTLADNVERLQSNLSGILHGNGLDNIMSFYTYASGSLYGEDGNDSLSGGTYDDSLYGGAGDDQLSADAGNDVLDGGAGADDMRGGNGSDTYYVDSASDLVYEYDDPSWYDSDKVFSSIASYTLTNEVENLELLAGAHAGYGNAASNIIVGNAADNLLAGNGGSDTVFGGGGADIYVYNIGDGGDILVDEENIAGQIDVLRFGAGITTADVQVRKSVSDGIYVVVNGQTIRISDGKLYSHEYDLNAASRIERIEFADGTLWNVDQVANQAPVAVDVESQEAFTGESFSLVLPDPLFSNDAGEALTLQFDLPDWLSYDAPSRTLSGTPPAGIYPLQGVVITATDPLGQSARVEFAVRVFTRLNGTSGADTLTGTDFSDWITGLAGADTLDGGYDFDRLFGGAGDDTYVLGYDEDDVVELANEGNDLVKASSSYTLGDNVERLTLTGTDEVDGTGNALDNTLTGNNAANTLEGLGGNDILDGKSGSDTMIGGQGDDTYFVERTGDVIVENAGEGYDSVSSTISYTLQDGLEKLTLTGSSGLSGTGNGADNMLIGNTGANTLTGLGGNDTLDGKSGADTMIGGSGDDTYVVDNASDAVQEATGEGVDTVQSSIAHTLAANVENLTITGTGTLAGTGNALANVLIGGSGANALSGLDGNDTLDGKGGADTLTGGAGGDAYLMARTYGADTAVENDATAGVTDVARFLTGVAYDQLWFKRPSGSNNLEIIIIGTTDKLVIKDWYLGAQYRVEEIRTDDGNKVLYAGDVQTLANAMAGMTQPAQGQTTLTPAQRTTLDPIFASTWQNQPQGLVSMGGPGLAQDASEAQDSRIDLGVAPQTPPSQAPVATKTHLAGLPQPSSVHEDERDSTADPGEAELSRWLLSLERYRAKYGMYDPVESQREVDALISAMAGFAPAARVAESLPAESSSHRYVMLAGSP